MLKAEIKVNLKAKEDLEKLTKAIRKDVIENGLDKVISADVESLRATLRYIINEGIRRDTDVQQPVDPKELKLNIAKSDEEIIKLLTGLDLTKFAKTKDFSTLVDAGVVMVFDRQRDGFKVNEFSGHPMSSGVNLRLPMSSLDTFESQQAMAHNYFNGSLFIFQENGRLQYYLNPGVDLSRFIKIVCSNQAGDNKRSRDKFDQHAQRRGYADWSLLAEGLNEVKKNFINLNDVIDKIKEGEIETAQIVMNRFAGSRGNNVGQYIEQLENLKQKKNVDVSTEAYINIVNLIKNLRLKKRITKENVTYTLISFYNEDGEDVGDFFKKMNTALGLWKITNHRRWFQTLVTETEKVIKRITK